MAMLERSMRSTRATVAALEQRVVALELRLGAGGGGMYPSAVPSPVQSSYTASPMREDPFPTREEPSSARNEDPHPATEQTDPPAVKRRQPDSADGRVNGGAPFTALSRPLCLQRPASWFPSTLRDLRSLADTRSVRLLRSCSHGLVPDRAAAVGGEA